MNIEAGRGATRGISYIVIICILGILFGAIMSYNSLLRNERLQMYRTIYSDNALIIAETAMEILQKLVEEEFAKTPFERKNEFFKYSDLIRPKDKFEPVEFDSAKLTRLISESKPVARLIEIYGGPRYAKIRSVRITMDRERVKFFSEVPGAPDGFLADPREKFGYLDYQVEVEYYGIKKTLSVKKQFKIVSVLPKGLRYFSLFVKNIPRGSDLNRVVVDEDGYPVKGWPLLIDNGSFNREPTPHNVGMVFLGNEKPQDPIVLRLAHGDMPGSSGELFQLFEDLYFDIVYDKKYPSSKFMISHLDYGLCQEISGIRNYGIAFGRDINTSSIKIYGSPDNPTPTRILGNVRRGYVRLSLYQDKATCGGDDMGEMAFAIPGDFSTAGAVPIADPVDDPPKFKSCMAIAAKLFPGAASAYAEYSRFMNQILDVEPYNHGLMKGIRDRRGMRCDPRKIDDLKSHLYPSAANNFGGKPSRPANTEIATDDMRRISLDEKYIVPYVSYRFRGASDFDKFRRQFLDETPGGNRLNLGLAVSFEGEITLPPMIVARGGMIVCKKGNITISGDIVADPFQCQTLTLIALDGDVVINASRVDAAIIALGPTAKFVPQKYFSINGSLAVTSVDFARLAETGGVIRYNTALATKRDSPAFYYASIQPDMRNWEADRNE